MMIKQNDKNRIHIYKLINNEILSIVCKTKDNIFKFEEVKFLDKDDFIVGSDGIYEFTFKQIIKF